MHYRNSLQSLHSKQIADSYRILQQQLEMNAAQQQIKMPLGTRSSLVFTNKIERSQTRASLFSNQNNMNDLRTYQNQQNDSQQDLTQIFEKPVASKGSFNHANRRIQKNQTFYNPYPEKRNLLQAALFNSQNSVQEIENLPKSRNQTSHYSYQAEEEEYFQTRGQQQLSNSVKQIQRKRSANSKSKTILKQQLNQLSASGHLQFTRPRQKRESTTASRSKLLANSQSGVSSVTMQFVSPSQSSAKKTAQDLFFQTQNDQSFRSQMLSDAYHQQQQQSNQLSGAQQLGPPIIMQPIIVLNSPAESSIQLVDNRSYHHLKAETQTPKRHTLIVTEKDEKLKVEFSNLLQKIQDKEQQEMHVGQRVKKEHQNQFDEQLRRVQRNLNSQNQLLNLQQKMLDPMKRRYSHALLEQQQQLQTQSQKMAQASIISSTNPKIQLNNQLMPETEQNIPLSTSESPLNHTKNSGHAVSITTPKILTLKDITQQFNERFRQIFRDSLTQNDELQEYLAKSDLIQEYSEVCSQIIRYIHYILQVASTDQSILNKKLKKHEKSYVEQLSEQMGLTPDYQAPKDFLDFARISFLHRLRILKVVQEEIERVGQFFEQFRPKFFVEPESIENQIGGRPAVKEVLYDLMQRIIQNKDLFLAPRMTAKQLSEDFQLYKCSAALLKGNMRFITELLQDKDLVERVTLSNFAIVKYRLFQGLKFKIQSQQSANLIINQRALNIILEKIEQVRCFILPENHILDKKYAVNMAQYLLKNGLLRRFTSNALSITFLEDFLEELLQTLLVFQNYQNFVEKWKDSEPPLLSTSILSLVEDYALKNIPEGVQKPASFTKDLELKILKLKIHAGLFINPYKIIKNTQKMVSYVVTESFNLKELADKEAGESPASLGAVGSTGAGGSGVKGYESDAIEKQRNKQLMALRDFVHYFLESAFNRHNTYSVYDMIYLFPYLNIPIEIIPVLQKALLKYLQAQEISNGDILQILHFLRKCYTP